MSSTWGMYGGEEKCIKISVRKSERERSLGRCKSREENNVKINLKKKKGCVDVHWTQLAENWAQC